MQKILASFFWYFFVGTETRISLIYSDWIDPSLMAIGVIRV
jgi:hypothetical protein